jgi:hypothetical protein
MCRMAMESHIKLRVSLLEQICDAQNTREDGVMALILLLLLLVSGGFTYYGFRTKGKYGGLVPAILVILLIYLLVGAGHPH